MKLFRHLVVILSFTLFCGAAFSQSSVIDEISKSHIDANVPDEKDFASFLKRDVAEYFVKAHGKDLAVDYELLRKGPTQAGIAYPKYYAWIVVSKEGKPIEEGAVRLAAIDKKRFAVTHYFSRGEMEKNPEELLNTFPKEVAERLRRRVKGET
jgi:hypothetical protein